MDITEQQNLEAQLIQAQKMEAVGTLAGGIAHNFNNLLMSIQGNTSLMLLDTTANHPHYERLTTIEKSVQSGSKLTSQLLGYARGGSYEVKPISINRIIKETSATFAMTRKDITLNHDLADTLAGVKADRGQIEQAVLNIYVNAAEAMGGGGDLFITTRNIPHTEITGKPYTIKPGNYILLTIKDTGIGMDKHTQAKVFDPFFTTKGLAKGTGLGLASVYGIMKAHGGYIDVESKKGHGTTFFLYLPASQETIGEELHPAAPIETGKETILLVDDEEIILDVGEALLTSLGYTVLIAHGGHEAIDTLRSSLSSSPPDLVILDMIMPGMGGGETYDRMKEIHPTIKVLLSSGYSIDGQATEILKRGCNGFIQKPFTLGEISKAIREVVGEG
jgi:two-component system cell cycle sensor histidine kinase/response regulator CckA